MPGNTWGRPTKTHGRTPHLPQVQSCATSGAGTRPAPRMAQGVSAVARLVGSHPSSIPQEKECPSAHSGAKCPGHRSGWRVFSEFRALTRQDLWPPSLRSSFPPTQGAGRSAPPPHGLVPWGWGWRGCSPWALGAGRHLCSAHELPLPIGTQGRREDSRTPPPQGEQCCVHREP